MNDFHSDLDEAMSGRTHTAGCPGRAVEEECTCGATLILYTAERFEEMRQALADRNDLARQCADIRDELAAKVRLLEPLATAGREFIAAWEERRVGGNADDEEVDFARNALREAAEAWWDR